MVAGQRLFQRAQHLAAMAVLVRVVPGPLAATGQSAYAFLGTGVAAGKLAQEEFGPAVDAQLLEKYAWPIMYQASLPPTVTFEMRP